MIRSSRDAGDVSRSARKLLLLVLLASVVLLVSGCGVGTDAAPTIIDNSQVPRGLLAPSTPTTSVTGPSRYVTIYLVDSTHLVAVSRQVPEPVTLDAVLEALGNGQTSAEAAQGLASPASTASPMTVVRMRGTTAVIGTTEGFTTLGGGDQITALAQLVYTATSFPGVTAVSLRIGGRPVSVPIGSGSLSSGPLTRSDYSSVAPL